MRLSRQRAAALGRRISPVHEPGADYCCARRASSMDPLRLPGAAVPVIPSQNL